MVTQIFLKQCRGVGWRMWLLALMTLNAAAADPKRVLILDPFGRDVAPFTAVVSAFRTTLAQELGEPVDFYEVPLDLARFTEPEGEGPLVTFLEGRLKSHPVDLVVPIGGASVQFAARNRERLFPDTPVLVVGGDPRLLPPGFLRTNATLVTHKINLPGMVEDILQLQPQTTNIVVVFGASALERFWVNECRREFQSFTNRVGFTWLNDLPLEQILERCAALPPRSFILHGMFVVDAAGIPCEKNEALRRLHQVANAPLFGYFASEFGLGSIGGRLYQGSEIGAQGARTAIRILRGERPESIPPEVLEATVPVYDWRELQRWGISEASLPAGSIIRFRQPSFWELYRWPITGAVLFCLLQAALIIGLLINRAKRREGEAEATLVADISSKFVNLPPSEVDREIVDAQRRICEFLGLDLSSLWQWSMETPRIVKMTHIYRPLGGPPLPEPMYAHEHFPWCQQQVETGRTVVVSCIEDVPAEAARDQEVWRHLGIKTTLTFPLSLGRGPVIGALSFNTMRKERTWPDALVKRLQLVAQIFTNALARKRADHALRESEERMTLAAEAAKLGVWGWDIARNRVWGSERWLRLFGFASGEDVSFEKIIQRIHPDDRETVEQEVRRALVNGSDYAGEFRAVLPGGTERWIASRGRGYPDANGKPARMLGAAIDITERKRSEAALHASEELSRATFEQAAVGIAHVGTDGRWLKVNDKFCAIVGYPRDELLKLIFQDITHPEDLETDLNFGRQILSGEIKTYSMEKRYIRKDRSLVWVILTVSLVRTPAGAPLHFISVVEDITERKQAEAELLRERAELAHVARVSTLGALAGTLAHELNQPLNAILNNAQAGSRFLAGETPDLAEVRGALEDIAQDTKRAGEVIRQIRALVKKDEPNFQPLDLNRIIAEVVRLLHSDSLVRRVRIVLELAPSLPLAQGDGVQVQQVVLNLLLNAFDAMKEVPEGERTVRLRTRQPEAASLQIEVSDCGTGVSRERLANLFEPFHSSKREGLGLGLSISHSIIAAHEGRLWAENNPGRGATFYFTLPVHKTG